MHLRRAEDDDMLVTHLPPEVALDGGEGKEGDGEGREVASIEGMDREALVARVAATTDPDERARLMAEIQTRFGNRVAELVAVAAASEASP